MDDTYRRTGRGGAGNFGPVAGKKTEDLEVQTPSVSNIPVSDRAALSEYSHVGRGGAGNWAATADVAKADKDSGPAAGGKSAAFGGRGGAGNFRAIAEEERRAVEERVKEAGRKVEEKVRKDVEIGLLPPPKAYHVSKADDADMV